jgi:hypothetical protein
MLSYLETKLNSSRNNLSLDISTMRISAAMALLFVHSTIALPLAGGPLKIRKATTELDRYAGRNSLESEII